MSFTWEEVGTLIIDDIGGRVEIRLLRDEVALLPLIFVYPTGFKASFGNTHLVIKITQM